MQFRVLGNNGHDHRREERKFSFGNPHFQSSALCSIGRACFCRYINMAAGCLNRYRCCNISSISGIRSSISRRRSRSGSRGWCRNRSLCLRLLKSSLAPGHILRLGCRWGALGESPIDLRQIFHRNRVPAGAAAERHLACNSFPSFQSDRIGADQSGILRIAYGLHGYRGDLNKLFHI